jgi:glucose-1-phosphate thymidylyltransferase
MLLLDKIFNPLQTMFVCGGRGTRLNANKAPNFPKALLSLGQESILERLIRLTAQVHSSTVPPIFIISSEHPLSGTFLEGLPIPKIVVKQRQPDGVASAILLAKDYVKDPVLVCLGDAVFHGHFSPPFPLLPAVGILQNAPPPRTQQNCGITLRNGVPWEFEDRPIALEDKLCGIGMYLLTPDVINLFGRVQPNSKGERGISEALQFAAQEGVGFGKLFFHGDYLNVNTPADLLEAQALATAFIS